MKKGLEFQLVEFQKMVLKDLSLLPSEKTENNIWANAKSMKTWSFWEWFDKNPRSKSLSLLLFVARCVRVDDEDNGSMEQVVSKLSQIYNNHQRAHTKVQRAEKDMILVQTS